MNINLIFPEIYNSDILKIIDKSKKEIHPIINDLAEKMKLGKYETIKSIDYYLLENKLIAYSLFKYFELEILEILKLVLDDFENNVNLWYNKETR